MQSTIHSSAVSAAKRDLVETSLATGGFTRFTDALTAAGLVKELRGPGPFTLFAPTDEAFEKLPPEQLEALMNDKRQLGKVLHYHVLRGRLFCSDLPNGKAKTLEGTMVSIGATDDGLTIEQANVTRRDIVSSNGVIHAIDKVMFPGAKAANHEAAKAESAWSGKRRLVPAARAWQP